MGIYADYLDKRFSGKDLTRIKALTLHLSRSEGHERYLGCNLMHCKVLASSSQHLMAEAPGMVPADRRLIKFGARG